MVDRESGNPPDTADTTRRLVASLRRDDVSSPVGLRERVSARIRSELLRLDLLDLFTGAPVRLVRQLLRRRAPASSDPSSRRGR